MDQDELEPEVPPGLSTLAPAQRALAEFMEIDPDLLAAVCVGSTNPSPTCVAEDQDINAWLKTWSNSDMKAVLEDIATGRGQQAERLVKSRYAAWLKAQRPTSSSSNPRRTVAKLQALAESAASERRKREAATHKKRETERRQQHEAHLRKMMIKVKTHWKRADTEARRGVASGYDKATDILTDLAEGYTLTSSRAEFERDLQHFLISHARRHALLRRLTKAGLWSE